MAYQIRAKSDTWLTRDPAPPSTVPDHLKAFVPNSGTFDISAYRALPDHLKITLGKAPNGHQTFIKGRNTWHIDKKTVEVLHDGQIVSLSPQSSAAKISSNRPSGRIPQQGIDLIKQFEGYATKLPDGRAKAYPDTNHGWQVPTIGYGTTTYPDGRKVQQGDIITRAEAEAYLMAHIEQSTRAAMERIPTWRQMNDNQRGAIYSFAYNLGAGFYRGSRFESITRVCDSPDRWTDLAWVKEQFVKYRDRGTTAEAGLRRRREAEATLFCA